MKKIIATALCLTLGAPCFAAGPMGPHHSPHPTVHHTTYVTHNVPPRHHMHRGHRHHHGMSPGAKTAVAVAGVTGLAILFAAIAD